MWLRPWKIRRRDKYCWSINLAGFEGISADSSASPFNSELVLYENDVPLGMPHAIHDNIGAFGRGRYSHWNSTLLFSTSDNTSPRLNLRRYRVGLADIPVALYRDVEDVVRDIDQSSYIETSRVLPFLSRRSLAERIFASRRFALSAWRIGADEMAMDFALRSWRLGGHVQALFFPLVTALRAQGAHHDIWSIFQDAMLAAQKSCNHDFALDVHTLAHETIYEAYRQGKWRPQYQDAVLAAGASQAARAIQDAPSPRARQQHRPLQVGYVLTGEEDERFCSIPDIVTELAAAHDAKSCTTTVFSFNPRARVPIATALEERLQTAGVELIYGEAHGGPVRRLNAIRNAIMNRDIDVLVFSNQTGLHYQLAAMRAAPVQVGLGLGVPDDYTSICLDYTASFLARPALDSLCDAVHIPPFMPSTRYATPAPYAREEFGLTDEHVVLMSAGRPGKFRVAEYWRCLATVLQGCPNCRLLVVGTDSVDIPDFGPDAPPIPDDRVQFLGWRNDILRLLPLADIAVDTYPHGGGYFLFEAMNLAIPVVGTSDAHLKPFAEANWTPIGDYLPESGKVHRDDPRAFIDRVLELANSQPLRATFGQECREIAERLSRVEDTARALEKIFLRLSERT